MRKRDNSNVSNPETLDVAPEDQSLIYAEITDQIAAQIGKIVTLHTLLNQKMIDVYRVILHVETHDAAALAYGAIPTWRIRMETLRQVLDQGTASAADSASYATIIEEFEWISKIRDECTQSVWWTDSLGRLWISRTDKATAKLLDTRLFDEHILQSCCDRIPRLMDMIFETTAVTIDLMDRQTS